MDQFNQLFTQFIAWFKPIDAPSMIVTSILVQFLKKPLKLKGMAVILFAFILGLLLAGIVIFKIQWPKIIWPIFIADTLSEGIKYAGLAIVFKHFVKYSGKGIRLAANAIVKKG